MDLMAGVPLLSSEVGYAPKADHGCNSSCTHRYGVEDQGSSSQEFPSFVDRIPVAASVVPAIFGNWYINQLPYADHLIRNDLGYLLLAHVGIEHGIVMLFGTSIAVKLSLFTVSWILDGHQVIGQ